MMSVCRAGVEVVAQQSGSVGPEPIPKLVEALKGTDKVARWKASMALGKIGAAAVPALIEVLKDTNPQARIAAANALRDMKAQAAPAVRALAESLSAVMEEPMGQTVASIEVRRTAAGALGAIGPPTSASEGSLPAVPALVDMLLGKHELVDPRPEAPGVSRVYELRGAAAWVLQIIGSRAAEFPQTVPALAAALKDPERMVRLNAANALGRFGPAAKAAVPALVEALKHPDQFTRIYAALALGGIGRDATPAVPALKAALATIRDDRLSQDRIRRVIERVSGSRITGHATRKPPIANRKSQIARAFSLPSSPSRLNLVSSIRMLSLRLSWTRRSPTLSASGRTTPGTTSPPRPPTR